MFFSWSDSTAVFSWSDVTAVFSCSDVAAVFSCSDVTAVFSWSDVIAVFSCSDVTAVFSWFDVTAVFSCSEAIAVLSKLSVGTAVCPRSYQTPGLWPRLCRTDSVDVFNHTASWLEAAGEDTCLYSYFPGHSSSFVEHACHTADSWSRLVFFFVCLFSTK